MFGSGLLTIQCTFSKENDFNNIVLLSLNWSLTAYMWYLQGYHSFYSLVEAFLHFTREFWHVV